MSGIVWHIFAFGVTSIFVIVIACRTFAIIRLPINLRWELAPIPHEKGKGRLILFEQSEKANFAIVQPLFHFSPISQNWAGQPLVSYATMLKFIRTTRTDTGFHCRARLGTTAYETRRKIASEKKREKQQKRGE